MNITPINLTSSYKNIKFGLSGINKQKTIENPRIVKEAANLKYAVEESIRRWNVDLPIPGNVTHAKVCGYNIMLNRYEDTIFAHVKKSNNVDRIITVSDDGTTSVTKTYVFDPKTHQLKKYSEEKN